MTQSLEEKREALLRLRMRQRPAPATVSPLVTLAEGDGYFCVHASGGSAAPYLALAQRVGCGFHALEAPGIHHGHPLDRIEDFADLYADIIRARQPEGPYYLAGWSVGGTIALELARRLGDVAQLVLLDTKADGADPPPPDSYVLRTFVTDIAVLQDRPPPSTPETGLDAESTVALLEAEGLVPPDVHEQTLARLRVFVGVTHAFHRYRMPEYGGAVTLVAARDNAAVDSGRWRSLIPHIDVRTFPGDHYSLLRPPTVDAVAEVLRELRSH